MSVTQTKLSQEVSPTKLSTKGTPLDSTSRVGSFHWTDVLIPESAGTGKTKTYYQRRTLAQYAGIATLGLWAFRSIESPAIRASALGLLFPGAGLVAVATIPSIIAFVIYTAALPVALFAWFGCGGVFFPIFLWVSSSGLAGYLAQDSVFEHADKLWACVCLLGIGYLATKSSAANVVGAEKRKSRNEFLVNAVQENQKTPSVPVPGSREVDQRTLRFVQWYIERGLQDFDDWKNHDVIDQFQTAAVRYQLYEIIYSLGLYQCHYTPNFHGYLSKAQRNAMEKSTTQFVMNFWKWESIFGKLKFSDWNPIKKDNIMVTGYILQALGIYESNTGDKRYHKKDCLEFVVTDKRRYKTDVRGIADAVFDNMNQNPYTLYPCEPNWLYTPCNLVGIGGIVVTDRILGLNRGQQLRSRFVKALEEEFTESDGSILPIRSELTGFTIPGLCGVLTDCINSLLCAAYLPQIAHRNWAMARHESIRWSPEGKLDIIGLTGADKLDTGNYKPGEGNLRGVFAAAAAEFGDERINKECLRQLDTEFFPVEATPTGSLKNKGLSMGGQGMALRARLCGYQDWTNMITVGPAKTAIEGPILTDIKFPEVLVAKAFSHDGKGLELVLYNGLKSGVFTLGLDKLMPGMKYVAGGSTFEADGKGQAEIEVAIDGRTVVEVRRA